ncbi:MAG: two-component regulator propeller domain-containing protein, partial [Bacteroidales bacterium]
MPFLLLLLLLLTPSTLFASPFSFRHYRVEQGLASNGVRDILQDRRGFIWVATNGGLNRFDGHNFKRFGTLWADTLLAGNRLFYCLLEDSRGRIWAGSEEGLFCYDSSRELFVRFGASDGDDPRISVPVWALAEDAKGRLWVGTHGSGVLRVILPSHPNETSAYSET